MAQPSLYRTLLLKVPLHYQCNEQNPLEKLIGCPSKGLQFTTRIWLCVQYDTSPGSWLYSRFGPSPIAHADNDEFLVYEDDRSQTSALNLGLRLLLGKLPRNSLLSFWYVTPFSYYACANAFTSAYSPCLVLTQVGLHYYLPFCQGLSLSLWLIQYFINGKCYGIM